jgi:hypothetical protein
MKWFRFYDGALHDPKVQRLPAPLFKDWVNLLCLASQNEPRGQLPDVPQIAFGLHKSLTATTRVLTSLTELGLLDSDGNGQRRPHNWDRRQFLSDDVGKRVKRHRNSAGNVT